jgi:hypothetical protein
LQIKTKIVSSHTTNSKLVKEEVNSTVILPSPFSIPWYTIDIFKAKNVFGKLLVFRFTFQNYLFCGYTMSIMFSINKKNSECTKLQQANFICSDIEKWQNELHEND